MKSKSDCCDRNCNSCIITDHCHLENRFRHSFKYRYTFIYNIKIDSFCKIHEFSKSFLETKFIGRHLNRMNNNE